MRIEDIVKSVEVDMILELFTRNKENDLDQAINNEVNGEFNFLTELPVKEDNVKASPQQKKEWPCAICDKIFKTKYYLKEHKRIHSGEKKYCTPPFLID